VFEGQQGQGRVSPEVFRRKIVTLVCPARGKPLSDRTNKRHVCLADTLTIWEKKKPACRRAICPNVFEGRIKKVFTVYQKNENQLTLVQSAISGHSKTETNKRRFNASIYADMCSITSQAPKCQNEAAKRSIAIRGSITNFSKKSRKRMIEHMAKIRSPGTLQFVTLTYTDKVWFSGLSGRDLQKHLETFCHALEHNFDAGIVWRKEFKRRQSGTHTGQIAPHLHLIIRGVGACENFHNWVSTAWTRITGDKCRVDVQVARSRRHAYSYVSKYVAKTEEDESLISEIFHNTGDIGRHWGIRGKWDVAASVTVELSQDETIQLKRLIRSWLKSKNRQRFAKIAGKISAQHGLSVFGLGDESNNSKTPTILRLIAHAHTLARARI